MFIQVTEVLEGGGTAPLLINLAAVRYVYPVEETGVEGHSEIHLIDEEDAIEVVESLKRIADMLMMKGQR